jgi:meiotic recombination protein SPO11
MSSITTSNLSTMAYAPPNIHRDTLITTINALLADVRICVSERCQLLIPLASLRRNGPPGITAVRFPGTSIRQARRFVVHLHLIKSIQRLLLKNQTMTKRDLFYHHVPLYRSQAVLDRALEVLSATFHVPRSALHIVACPKGLVAGDIHLNMYDGKSIDCSAQSDGVLIPQRAEITSVALGAGVKCILMLEKHAIFRRLWREGLREKAVLVTGKGYPDYSTREFLRLLSETTEAFALVDLDPHGFEILATTKIGSQAAVRQGDILKVPKLRWIGVDWDGVRDAILEGRNEGLLKLTPNDRKKAANLLKRKWIKKNKDLR